MKFAVRKREAEGATIFLHRPPIPEARAAGFSIVELMVAAVILTLILGIIFSITQMISQTWGKSTAKIEAFQAARAAFDTMSRKVSQATLNTYYDYYDNAGNTRASYGTNTSAFTPRRYGRVSDLHFISGRSLVASQITHSLFFQAPEGYTDNTNYTGLETLLNGCGFFIAYDKDNTLPGFVSGLPNKPPDRYRFRLMQFLQPTQSLQVYNPSSSSATGQKAWFQDPLTANPPPVSILSENIIAMAVLPKLSSADAAEAAKQGKPAKLTTDFEYDTRQKSANGLTDHQLPPVIELVMVAIDENSARRFCLDSNVPSFGLGGGIHNLFQDPDKLEDDLKTLTDELIEQRVAYRVFRSEIALRGAKWSSSP
jgi:uncharacterized protein (TIGR02599 family)